MKVYIEEFLKWLSEWFPNGCSDNQRQKSCLKYTIAPKSQAEKSDSRRDQMTENKPMMSPATGP
jgi:hypothetical protein